MESKDSKEIFDWVSKILERAFFMFEGWVNFIQEISLFFSITSFCFKVLHDVYRFLSRERVLLFPVAISMVDSMLVQYLLIEYFAPL